MSIDPQLVSILQPQQGYVDHVSLLIQEPGPGVVTRRQQGSKRESHSEPDPGRPQHVFLGLLFPNQSHFLLVGVGVEMGSTCCYEGLQSRVTETWGDVGSQCF